MAMLDLTRPVQGCPAPTLRFRPCHPGLTQIETNLSATKPKLRNSNKHTKNKSFLLSKKPSMGRLLGEKGFLLLSW